MKKAVNIITFLVTLVSFGQNNFVVKEKGKTLHDIIPINCIILDTKTGDLNHDGILDLVFAIQDTDKKNIKKNDGMGSDTYDLNPRILGIYFGTKSGEYSQKLVSKEFIILRDNPVMDEPFDGFKINKNGILSIKYKFWFSVGSWFMSTTEYKFRFQEDAFALIGYESEEIHRGTGENTSYSINFLTRKMEIIKGSISDDEITSNKNKKFVLKKLLTLKSMKKPFEMEFEEIRL